MNKYDLESVLRAYSNGQTADILRAKINTAWGVLWTVPPCSPTALAQIGHQFMKSRAEALQHFRVAKLTKQDGETQRALIITDLPSREQIAYCLETRQPIALPRFLCDSALDALMEASNFPAKSG